MALSVQSALPAAGVPHEIRHFVWTHGWGQIFKDLQDVNHLLQKAEDLADEVRKVKDKDPDRPIYLLGKSGGAGLVLAAAELLPPACLERIVLLSPAVSPTYDLVPAFRATRGEIVCFYSVHDKLVLSWGTRRFGTVDRLYMAGAGLHGFRRPPQQSAEDESLYRRLIQVPWNPAMILEGNLGNHVGTSMPAFMAKEVAPWLKP
jgi:pimeloyl-ACP methyl ester carboxylesterase